MTHEIPKSLSKTLICILAEPQFMIFSGMARFVTQLFSSHLEEKIGISIPTSGGPEPNLNLGLARVSLVLGALGLNKI